MNINMEELIRQALRNNQIEVVDPEKSNPSFRERMKEYADGLDELKEEKEEEKK